MTNRVRGRLVFRTAAKPSVHLPDNVTWIKAVGPFIEEAERALITHHGIDVLVTKNSGGDSTYGKIKAARGLGVPVYMLNRPKTDVLENCYHCAGEMMADFLAWLNKEHEVKQIG